MNTSSTVNAIEKLTMWTLSEFLSFYVEQILMMRMDRHRANNEVKLEVRRLRPTFECLCSFFAVAVAVNVSY